MQDCTYTYHIGSDTILVKGFIASLLQQGDEWDIRCLRADMFDYHEQQYSRMDPTIALEQELRWWLDFVDDERMATLPRCEQLARSGLSYLYWRVQEQVLPLSDEEKLNMAVAIRVDEHRYFYKCESALGLCDMEAEDDMPAILLANFPAQLLSYAACTTIDACIRQVSESEPVEWVDILLGWLQSPPMIRIRNIEMNIPDVYVLYATYMQSEKALWDAENRRRYTSGQSRQRYFMQYLLRQTKEECDLAIQQLRPYFSDKQYDAYVRYLTECQQYIVDQTKTKRQSRSMHLNQFFEKKAMRYPRNKSTLLLHKAATNPINPAAALAKVVKHLQEKKILKADLRPLTHFIRVVNHTFETQVNYDTFSKHFR